MLYRDADRCFLSVVCGTVGMFTIDFELSRDEVESVLAPSGPVHLARKVAGRPEAYRERHLPDFGVLPAVVESTRTWREAHAVSPTSTPGKKT
jgi:hypothetical protein